MSGPHCENYDVKRETVHCYPVNSSLLTAVARDRWNLSAVFKFYVCFVWLYNKSLNDWSLGEQWILFPSGPVIKCLLYSTVNLYLPSGPPARYRNHSESQLFFVSLAGTMNCTQFAQNKFAVDNYLTNSDTIMDKRWLKTKWSHRYKEYNSAWKSCSHCIFLHNFKTTW